MNKLAAFLLVLATDAAVAQSFNNGDDAAKEAMLLQAGVENAAEVVKMSDDSLKRILAEDLIAKTGSWYDIILSSGNEDNKNNIGRMGIKRKA